MTRMPFLVLAFAGALAVASCRAAFAEEELKLEIPVLTDFERYLFLAERPGYLAIALENNNLSPSLSSSTIVKDRGKSVEVRNGIVKFIQRNGSIYEYEFIAVLNLGVTESRLVFPVVVDASTFSTGKVTAKMKSPLAALIPAEVKNRIQIKMRLVANLPAQRKVLDYLDGIAKARPTTADRDGFLEAILLDGYDRIAATRAQTREGAEPVPPSSQWLLIATIVIWFVLVPIILFVQRRRQMRQQS